MWLAADIAVWIAIALGVTWLVSRRLVGVWPDRITPLSKELALMFAFYAAWRLLGEYRFMTTEDAFERGRSVWELERWLHLPNELTMQRWTLRSTALVKFFNSYYIVCHVFPLGIFLVWLYVRHRASFAHWRNQLVFVSLICQLLQFVPVAPPRLFDDLGFIDTGAMYGPRVYDSVGENTAGQLAAMPSMHVAWAMVVGIATVMVGRSRWRWIGAAHALFTVLAVTVTAYHWLADGIVATVVLLIGMAIARSWNRRSARRPAIVGYPRDETSDAASGGPRDVASDVGAQTLPA